jgi:nicotinamidase-related amidase
MFMNAERSHLLVVDIQARLMPAIHDSEQVVRHANILLQAAGRLGVPVTVTEQYPKGLGSTVSAVVEALPESAAVLPKTTFSAAGDPATMDRVTSIRASGRNQLVICGAEAHVCVLQTALGFKSAGFDVFVVADAVSSRSPHSVSAACARLLHAGCHWVTMEMVVFEWLERAATDDFRALSPLLK